jgi:fructokinase
MASVCFIQPVYRGRIFTLRVKALSVIDTQTSSDTQTRRGDTMTARMRIGIDLGGTKIEAIAITGGGVERARRRMASPRGSYERTLDALAGIVHDVERDCGARGTIGVGIPGTVSPATGLIKNSNSTWLNGRELAGDLARLLDRPVRFANDANCFALSEASDGAAAGAEVVFGVIVGTGTGGGVVVRGQLLVGANAIGGEWGHNPLPAARGVESPGPPCYCGRSGCIETFLCGPALERDYAASAGECVPAQEIAARAQSGDAVANAVLGRYEDRMARALASVINVLDPDVIVLGGGLSNIDRLYERVPRLWSPHIFSDAVSTRLVRATHGDSSGVRGAAWLWEE